MRNKVLGSIACLILIWTCVCSVSVSEEVVDTENMEFLQYFVKWNSSKEPEDIFITEEEYLAILEKDKNNNGISDDLEDDDEVIAAAIETGILGDLNGDETVDNRDVILLYRQIAGWEQDINKRILDFNGDGYTSTSDADHLLKYVSGWPNVVLYSGKKNDIIYHLYSESMYKELEINNPNQDYYYSSEGLTLKNIQANGYIFEGWYDGEGENATRIRKIDIGEEGEIELYARWTPRTYRIDFDSELVEVTTKYYTIETGATLTNPSLTNYMFVGWTNQDDGRLVKGIPKGSFGNLTLVANWASRRNLTRKVPILEDPIIAEDSANGKIVFVYRIGDIENIPLFTLYRFSTAEGIITSVSLTEQTSISTSDARTIGETIAKATTDSATWTLSEGWNENTSVSTETLQETGRTREEAETIAKSTTNTYRLDSSVGESEVIVDSSQYAFKGSGTVGHSSGQTTETGQNAKLSVNHKTEAEAGLDLKIFSAKAKSSWEFGAEYSNYAKHTNTSTDSWSNTLENSASHSNTATTSKEWNTTASYSNSNTMSSNHTTSQQISEMISDKYGYGQSYSQNGEQSSGQAFTTQNTQQSNYSNTVTYNSSALCERVTTYTTDGRIDGYYRQVLAGTAHVFGVVGYDVATCSYFTYTFTVMDDETYEFLDYSKTTPNFNDNEIGVLPFEIPSFVNDYVNSRVAKSTGLQINIGNGKVTGYSGEDSIVVIPSYVDIDNGDGTYSSVKITGLDAGAFRNNTTIQGVMLSDFITEIPDSAFEGCTSLRDILIPNLTSIGNRAFYDCTSLSTLTIPIDVVSLGNNAFYNVSKVNITAVNKNVALAALNSGVKNLVLNISAINNEIKDTVLVAPSSMSSFEIRGERKQYENLRIKSDADKTTINGINFVDCAQIPMELHSSTVDLNQTSVSTPGYCMILAANNCNMNLFGTNQMISSTGNAMVCGNLMLDNSNSNVQASLQVSGNIYICGSMTNQNQYLNLTNGNIIRITQEQFNQYINGVYKLVYDANGGSVSENEKTGYSGVAVGTLPIPTRTGYTFAGWYTAPDDGTMVTPSSSFTSSSTVTIYAHWAANEYIVEFNANGGSSVNPSSKTVTYNNNYGVLADATKAGCTLEGWYTSASGGTKITENTNVTIAANQTLYAHWANNTYTVTYNANGGSVSPMRKQVTYDDTYGSLAIPTRTGYTFTGWYTDVGTQITENTKVAIASAHTIYAYWTANDYTYNIVYKSSNGTSLGTGTVKRTFGTTNTVTPSEYAGYSTPDAQNVAWDTTSKTITFIYTPSAVDFFTTGTIQWCSKPKMKYSAKVEHQNRTANSVQIRVVWTTTLVSGYDVYSQKFSGSCNGVSIPSTTVVAFNDWQTQSSSSRSKSGTSSWVTIPLATTGPSSLTINVSYYQYNSNGTNMYNYEGAARVVTEWTVPIPAY